MARARTYRDGAPFTLVVEDERAAAAGGCLVPAAKDTREQRWLQRDDAERREKPAVAQPALHHVGRRRRVDEERRGRRARLGAHLGRPQPAHIGRRWVTSGRAGPVAEERARAAEVVVGERGRTGGRWVQGQALEAGHDGEPRRTFEKP